MAPLDTTPTDVLVVGLGPAGLALSHRCAEAGLSVRAVETHPHRTWTPTYAIWDDELPHWLDRSVIATTTDEPDVWTTRRQTIPRAYSVLDSRRLQDSLSFDYNFVVTGTAVDVAEDSVTLTDGTTLRAGTVIDARGTTRTPATAEQTAFGVVVDGETGRLALEGATAWFMDWRRDNGTSPTDPPSFLYAVPLGNDEILLEETCLVGRPGLHLRELRARLEVRLRSRGVRIDGTERLERVRFPVEPGPRRLFTSTATAFGSRGGFMHPGTGYSVAMALGLADPVARAIAGGEDLRELLWPLPARGVRKLRRAGLKMLLGMDAAQVAPFFATFFDLPIELQRAYLSDRNDLAGTAVAMRKLFAHFPPGLRSIAVKSTILPGNRSPKRSDSTIMDT